MISTASPSQPLRPPKSSPLDLRGEHPIFSTSTAGSHGEKKAKSGGQIAAVTVVSVGLWVANLIIPWYCWVSIWSNYPMILEFLKLFGFQLVSNICSSSFAFNLELRRVWQQQTNYSTRMTIWQNNLSDEITIHLSNLNIIEQSETLDITYLLKLLLFDLSSHVTHWIKQSNSKMAGNPGECSQCLTLHDPLLQYHLNNWIKDV